MGREENETTVFFSLPSACRLLSRAVILTGSHSSPSTISEGLPEDNSLLDRRYKRKRKGKLIPSLPLRTVAMQAQAIVLKSEMIKRDVRTR